MSENSKIQWTHHTFNPWRGCTKATWVDGAGKTHLHPGCLNCYAEVDMSVKLHGIKWGKGQERVPKADSGWGEPLRWTRKADAAGERHRVFCASLADVLDSEVPDSMRARLWDTIRQTTAPSMARTEVHLTRWHDKPGLDWLLLTKRPENWGLVPEDVRPLVWLGTSVSDQETADEWVPRLLESEGFRYRFLSVEPLVGPVDLEDHLTVEWNEDYGGARGDSTSTPIDWVIVGGESGPKDRRCNPYWIRNIVKQCSIAGVPVFVKQLGANASGDGSCRDCADEDGRCPSSGLPCDGLKDPKGGDWNEWPEDMRVRQFPG